MRWIYLAIIVLFAVAVLIFAFQNLETVTASFLGFSISAPVAMMIFVVYILGAVTGGSLFALLRRSYSSARPLVSS
jgi:lipopolysaccharide assembly protein A